MGGCAGVVCPQDRAPGSGGRHASAAAIGSPTLLRVQRGAAEPIPARPDRLRRWRQAAHAPPQSRLGIWRAVAVACGPRVHFNTTRGRRRGPRAGRVWAELRRAARRRRMASCAVMASCAAGWRAARRTLRLRPAALLAAGARLRCNAARVERARRKTRRQQVTLLAAVAPPRFIDRDVIVILKDALRSSFFLSRTRVFFKLCGPSNIYRLDCLRKIIIGAK